MSEAENKKSPVPATPKSLKNEINEKPSIPEDTRLNKIQWTDGIDKLLSTWADNALCYKWLHEKATYKYSRINFAFSIPIIVLSTISGTLSVGLSGYVPAGYQQYGQAGIGAINIFAGLLTTLQNFFRPSNLSEAHRIAALGWSKLYRNIANELRMQPNFRKEPNLFYKQCRTEFDRLLETQPIIPADIIQKFKKKFLKLKNLELPDVCDTLNHTEPYKEEFENIVTDLVNSARDSNYRMTSILEGNEQESLNETSNGNSEQNIEKVIENIEKTGGTLEPVWTSEGKKWRIRRSSGTVTNLPSKMPPPLRRKSLYSNFPPSGSSSKNNQTSTSQRPVVSGDDNIKNELVDLMKKSVVKNLSNKFKVESSGVVLVNEESKNQNRTENIDDKKESESQEIKEIELQEIRTEVPVEQKSEELNEPEFHVLDIQEEKENTENI